MAVHSRRHGQPHQGQPGHGLPASTAPEPLPRPPDQRQPASDQGQPDQRPPASDQPDQRPPDRPAPAGSDPASGRTTADLVADLLAATAPGAPGRNPGETDACARALLGVLSELPAGSFDHDRVRARLIELYLPLAEHLARRFRNRGEPIDDLTQVANLGLIKSVDGFDVTRGAAFTSYAIPMIVGELKRHFRDKGWDVRVPRRLQELRLEISRCVDELCQRLGRSPTVSDLAAHLGASEDDIIEGLYCGQAYRALSLHAPVTGEDGGASLGDLLGGPDRGLDGVEEREALRPIIARLPLREQKILALRFFGNMTQSQIAVQLGISQMHVSRLLSHALAQLRTDLGG